MLSTSTRYCLAHTTAVSFAVKQSVKAPPHGLRFSQMLGTGHFLLSGDVNGAALRVDCDVSASRNSRHIGYGKARNGARRVKAERIENGSKAIYFMCNISVFGHAFPLAVQASCHTLLGQLVIDSVCFHAMPHLQAEDLNAVESQAVYQGPSITQSFLADLVVKRAPLSCPLWSPRQAASRPFDASMNYSISHFSKFGHMPVHTLNPTLANDIAQLLKLYGVDDDVALFVEDAAYRVADQEMHAWSKVIGRFLH